MLTAPAQSKETGATSSCPDLPAPPAGDAEPAAVAAGPGLPVAGQRWREVYDIHAQLQTVSGARAWLAHQCDTDQPVTLWALPALKDGRREAAWQILQELAHPGIARVISVHEIGAVRVEVHATPPGQPLMAWRPPGTLEISVVEEVLRALVAAIAALHERGLAHFAIKPQHVFVSGAPGALQITLGGLESATAFAASELLPVAVDPFYAPPEAAGLFQHSPGEGLCAWDWWSLGRVMQELILGQHVLAALLKRDVSRVTPELLTHAEALLLEREAGGTRAGAVEAMPPLEPRLDSLLRGLLTSARDARWGREAVEQWLAGASVGQHYRLPRNERLFRWRGRAYAVTEAAGLLQKAENWSEAMRQIGEPEQPGTLAHFLGESPGHRALRDRQEEIRKVATAFALKTIAPEIVREVITAVGLLDLAGSNLAWRGHTFDHEGLQAIFAVESTDIDRLALLRAFAARPVVLLMERCDQPAARALTEFAQVAAAAEAVLRQNRWMRERDVTAQARLLRHALRPLSELTEAAKCMRETFACSTDPVVERIFRLPHPGRVELTVLLWLADNAAQRGFLAQREWAEREEARLRAEGAKQVEALSWLALARAFGAGPWWFMRWRFALPAWLLAAAGLSILWPGRHGLPLAAVPVLLGVAARLALWWGLRTRFKKRCPDAKPWKLWDGAARCRTEALGLHVGWPAPEIHSGLEKTNAALQKLTALTPPPVPVRGPARSVVIWALVAASWLCFAGLLGVAAWRVKQQRPSVKAWVAAWQPPKPAGDLAGADAAGEARPTGEDDEKDRGPVKVSWPFKPGDFAQKLVVVESVEARSEQLRAVKERAKKLFEPYKLETVHTLVALRVPAGDRFAVMLYDGAHSQLVNTRVFVLAYPPLPRAWIEVAEKPAIFIPE